MGLAPSTVSEHLSVLASRLNRRRPPESPPAAQPPNSQPPNRQPPDRRRRSHLVPGAVQLDDSTGRRHPCPSAPRWSSRCSNSSPSATSAGSSKWPTATSLCWATRCSPPPPPVATGARWRSPTDAGTAPTELSSSVPATGLRSGSAGPCPMSSTAFSSAPSRPPLLLLPLGPRIPLGALPGLGAVLLAAAAGCSAFGLAPGALGLRFRDVFLISNVAGSVLVLLTGANVPRAVFPDGTRTAGYALLAGLLPAVLERGSRRRVSLDVV
ncbi:hypothetical protein ACIOD0_26100 [Kitasatospora albolonga]